MTSADANGDVVTVESIDRIIPLDGDLAEVVFALGLGDRVPKRSTNCATLGYPLVMIDRPRDASGPATKIRHVAEALGVPERGEALTGDVQAAIDNAPLSTSRPASRRSAQR